MRDKRNVGFPYEAHEVAHDKLIRQALRQAPHSSDF